MNIVEEIRKAVRRLFGLTNISEAFGVDVAISSKMEDAIQRWTDMYENSPDWKAEEKGKFTMNIPAAIASEIARLVTLEMKSVVSGSPRADFINEQYQRVISKAREFTEQACALGAVAIKPYVDSNGQIKATIIQANDFYPVSFSDEDITAAVFLENQYIGDKKYTRLEYHKLDGNVYTITNKAYCLQTSQITGVQDNALGKEVPLTQVPEWAAIDPEVTINDIKHVLFCYFKMPFANNVEMRSPLGVSCYARAAEQIKKADELWSEIVWEFESGERAINVPEDFFHPDPTTGKPVIPKGKERLYRTFLWEQGQKVGLDTYSPEFRDSSLFNGLNKTLHKVEFLSGMAYGTISEPTETDKTATEVKQSKQRSFSTVTDVQSSLQKALTDLVYCIDTLASLYNLAPEGEYETSFEWDDSIVVDRDTEFTRLMAMATAGMISNEYVVAWYFGISLEEAKAMAPDAETDDEPPDEEE